MRSPSDETFREASKEVDPIAALWPERCRRLVAVSGYLINSLEANLQPLPPDVELGWWYQYYFSTERGRAGYDRGRLGCELSARL